MNNGTIDLSKVRGLEPEFVNRVSNENMLAKAAMSDPLPGSLSLAFPLPDKKVGTFAVRAPVAYDWTLLKALNSPIHRKILELNGDKANGETEFTDEEAWDICYQFTRPCKEVDRVFCNGGAKAIREASKELFAFNLQSFEIKPIVEAVIKQISLTWETAMKYSAEKDEDAASSPFPK